MAELVDALDSKSCSSNRVRVQVPLRPPIPHRHELWFVTRWYFWLRRDKNPGSEIVGDERKANSQLKTDGIYYNKSYQG